LEKESLFLQNHLMEYTDPRTSISMKMSTSTVIRSDDKWESYEPTMLTVAILDPRTGYKSIRASLCIHHIYDLINQVTNFMKVGPEQAFITGGNVSVVKYLKKSKAELLFNLAYDHENRKPAITMIVTNSVSTVGKLTIPVDFLTFKTMIELMKQYTNSFITVDTGTKTILTLNRLMGKITTINSNITAGFDRLTKELRNLSISQSPPSSEQFEIEEYDNSMDEIEEEQDVENDKSADAGIEFNKLCTVSNTFEDIELPDIPDDSGDSTKKEKRINPSKPFVNNFLNCDINRLREWSASFISSNKKSDLKIFTPIDMITSTCNISDDIMMEYSNTEGYYLMQYGMIKAIKDGVKHALVTGEGYPAKKVPIIKFHKSISKGDPLFEISKEILSIYIIYDMLVNKYFTWIDTNDADMKVVDEYRRTLYTMRILFAPFLFSLDINKSFEDEIEIEYNRCKTCGVLDIVEKEYADLTLGSILAVDLKMFKNSYDRIAKIITGTPAKKFTTTKEVYTIFEKHGIDKPDTDILLPEDIKTALTKTPSKPKQKTQKEVIKEAPVTKMDEKMKLFLECLKGYAEEYLLGDLKNNCKKFEDVSAFMQHRDIPAQMFKIKRAMEIDNTLKDRRSVLKIAKLLKEEDDVSQSRVLQDIPSDNNFEDVDLQSVIENNF